MRMTAFVMVVAGAVACGSESTAVNHACTVSSVTVAPPSATVTVGGSTTLTASVASVACDPAPVVSWHTTATGVATVSNGVVTGVAAGTATITASAGSASGTSSITVALGPFAITAISPLASETGISIDTPVQIRFSAAVDASTVSSATVNVSANGNAVTGSLVVSGNTVTFTPAAALTEFNTTYTVTVTTGLRSTSGDALGAPSVTTFTTILLDPSYNYRIMNESAGASVSLEASGDAQCIMLTTSGVSGQLWYFSAVTGQPGAIAIRNAFLGDAAALVGGDIGTSCSLRGGTIHADQTWTLTAFGAAFPNAFRLQSLNFGADKSLDATGRPTMRPTVMTSVQAWDFTRLAHR